MPIPRFYLGPASGYRPADNAGVVAAAQATAAAAQGDVAASVGRIGETVQAAALDWQERSNALAASRAFRQLDQWRLDYLKGLPGRRQDLAATQLDSASGQNRTGYELEAEGWAGQLEEQYRRATEGLSTSARQRLQGRFDQVAPEWGAQAGNALERLELEDQTKEMLDLAQGDRLSDAMDLFERNKDRYSAAEQEHYGRQLLAYSTQASVRAAQEYVGGIARERGWEAASTALNDPDTLKIFGLDFAEAVDLKRQVETFARDQATIAAGRRQAQLEANNDAWLADAWQSLRDPSKPLDLIAGERMVRNNEIDAAVYEQGRKIALQGRNSDDPEIFLGAEQNLAKVRSGALSDQDALAWLRRNAAGLTPETWKQAVRDVSRVRDPANAQNRPNVQMLKGLLTDHYETLATFGAYGTPEAEQAYIQAMMQFRTAADDPKATDESIRKAYEDIVRPAAQKTRRGFWSRIFNDQTLTYMPSGSGLTLPSEPLLGKGLLAPPVTTNRELQLRDPGREPLTKQEFIDTVKSLPKGSKEQADYYGRWVTKWQ